MEDLPSLSIFSSQYIKTMKKDNWKKRFDWAFGMDDKFPDGKTCLVFNEKNVKDFIQKEIDKAEERGALSAMKGRFYKKFRLIEQVPKEIEDDIKQQTIKEIKEKIKSLSMGNVVYDDVDGEYRKKIEENLIEEILNYLNK